MAVDPAACRAFVRAVPRSPVVATIGGDGSPHAAPVWADLDGDDTVVFTTYASSVKGRNLAADPRCALSWQDDSPPYSFVTAFGTAELVDDPEQVTRWARHLGGRFLGPDRAEEMAARNGVPGELVVRVRVARWVGAFDLSA